MNRKLLIICYDLKDAYELLNEYRNFNSVITIDNAAEMLDELIIKFPIIILMNP